MSLDILGPGSAINSITTRPTQTTTYGPSRTWFKPCSDLTTEDGTQLTADWLNNILAQARAIIDGSGVAQDNGDDMLWRAIEIMQWRYAVDTGVANALAITNTPPAPGYRAGLAFAVKVKFTNTGAATIALDGILPVANIVRAEGTPLIGGEMLAGRIALLFMDDALQFRLLNPAPVNGNNTLPIGRNILGQAAGGNKLASWTAAQMQASVGLAGQSYFGSNLTLSFNGATTGANGMDTGAMPTSADLSVYAIYNPSTNAWATLGCRGSTSNGPVYTGANMPAGYTASALLWVGVTNGSGNFYKFQQVNRQVFINSFNVLTNGAAVTPTSISLTGCVPAAANAMSGNCSTGTAGQVDVGGTSGATWDQMLGFQWLGSSGAMVGNFDWIPLFTAQTMYYAVQGSGQFASIAVDAYQF